MATKAGKAPTVISAGVVVSGRVEGAEDVEVFGAIKGSVHLDGDLYVDENARLDADIEVTHLLVHGIVVGRVSASGSVELSPTARVVGDITAPRVIVQPGARYRGTIDMGDIEDEIPGEGKASRGRDAGRGASRPAARSARPEPARTASPARAARPEPARSEARPEPKPAARPSREPAFTPEPEPAPEPVIEDDEDPELPEAAQKKKVAVKKRS